MKKTKKEKPTDLDLEETLKDIRGRFGEDSIMVLDGKPNVGVDAISTGSIGLDHAIGVGGFPRGRIVEIYGHESSGKTTLALHTVAEAQKTGVCAFVDAEHALDPQYAKRIGVQTDKLLISQPSSGDEALQIVESLVKSKKVAVVVIDSVAALVPKAEIEGQIGDSHMAGQARLMSQAMRMLTAHIAKTNTLVIFINQIRANIGGYGLPTTTAGGKALKFYASVRVEITKTATLKKGEDPIGSRVKAKVIKNKVASPFKQAEFDVVYNEGISRESEMLVLGEQFGVIGKQGNAYVYGEVKIGRGYESARQFLRENKDVSDEIVALIREKLVEIPV